MLPIVPGSDVNGQFVEDWTKLKAGTPAIIILKGIQDFVFKRMTFQENGYLLLESLNPEFQPYEVHVEDVLEVWKFHSSASTQMPDPEPEIKQLIRMVQELKEEMKELKR
jgi:hypothetical protein